MLDSDDVGIVRRLPQELHDRIEGFEGVVDQDILFTNGAEDIAAIVADALREARFEGLEFQVIAIARDKLRHLGHAEDTGDVDDIF